MRPAAEHHCDVYCKACVSQCCTVFTHAPSLRLGKCSPSSERPAGSKQKKDVVSETLVQVFVESSLAKVIAGYLKGGVRFTFSHLNLVHEFSAIVLEQPNDICKQR